MPKVPKFRSNNLFRTFFFGNGRVMADTIVKSFSEGVFVGTDILEGNI